MNSAAYPSIEAEVLYSYTTRKFLVMYYLILLFKNFTPFKDS